VCVFWSREPLSLAEVLQCSYRVQISRWCQQLNIWHLSALQMLALNDNSIMFRDITSDCTASYVYIYKGARGSIVVKALCNKREGHGFYTR
jgi:hypothetical protein